jgi:tetratricopeptide (TPR) repeat protein
LCDLALTYGFAEHAERITATLLLRAAADRARGGILPSMVDPATIVLDPANLAGERVVPTQASVPSPGAVSPASPSPRKPVDPAEEYRKGVGLKQKGMFQDAMSKFEAAAKDSGHRFKALVQRGLCLKAIGRLDDAASAFRHALAVTGAPVSDVMHVRYVLGLTLDGLGLPEEARDQFQAIHEVDPAFRDIADRLERGTGFPHSRLAWIKSLRLSWQQFRGLSA